MQVNFMKNNSYAQGSNTKKIRNMEMLEILCLVR